MSYNQEIQKNREYWNAVLGEKLCEKLLADNVYEEKIKPDIYQAELAELDSLCEKLFQKEAGWNEYPTEGTFGNFFRFFGRLAVEYIGDVGLISNVNLKRTVLSNLYLSIAWIPVRVLIQDIHSCKEKGLLKGRNDKEEYQDYQEQFLNDRCHIWKLCKQYPEMKRLLLLRIVTVTKQIRQILLRAAEDQKILNSRFFPENPFQYIKRIECGLSDMHNGGQTVAKIQMDNQKTIIYKPRNLEKDRSFMELYELFCGKAGLSFQNVRILAGEEYSWESFVEQQPCGSSAEIKRYFERTGILLFLSWLLDVSDMHGENIIAMGEYPIPIDLETLPGYPDYLICENADQMIQEELKHSVLSTGILPVATWGNDGEGIILNALHREEVVKTPFRVPVICDPESSKIHIAYRGGEKKLSGSLPVYEGYMADPAAYVEEILKGFEQAYRYFLEEKEQLMAGFAALFSGKSRYLIRHTQQYQMYLQSSFYPEFLESGMRRKLFLHILDKNQNSEELAGQERDDLYRMDIPVFYRSGTWENRKKKLKTVGEDDLKRQLSFIALSLGILEKRKFVREKETCRYPANKSISWKERAGVQVRRIADEICGMTYVTEDGDIGFWGSHVEENGNFRIGPAGIYLYEGIGGIAVFLAAALQKYPKENYRYFFELSVKKLFRHTEETAGKICGKETKYGGAFLGEGSVVFTYLLLYDITGEERFLIRAERHIKFIEKPMETENSMDYLSGLSGIISVLGRLYRITEKDYYKEIAARMGERVWECCEIINSGAGWRAMDDVMPLAGMAHGNSGLILAFAHLLELTRDLRYKERIEKLLAYEDSLYENDNWKDLRHPGGLRLCNNAWCHGAAGILLSRLKLRQCGFQDPSGLFERDMKRCRQIFLEDREPEELCLCHGLAGNYLVLGQYLQSETDPELKEEQKALGERIVERLEQGDISSREKYNPALMTGLSGIGLALCGDSFGTGLLG